MKWTWWLYRIKHILLHSCYGKSKKLTSWLVGRPFLTQEELNHEIAARIMGGRNFMACRLGTCEAFAMRTFYFSDKKKEEKAMEQLCTCAGFFPQDLSLKNEFVQSMEAALREADYCGSLFTPLEDYFFRKNLKDSAKITDIGSVVPVTMKEPWTGALKGKKVLVVHPFAETILRQYSRREKLFANEKMLPEFELNVVKAVQTNAGAEDNRFQSWFEALAYMKEEIAKIDYDIALLGCGAYGLPLAAWIRKQGKQAVHIGGGLQLLFGIRGKRWDYDEQLLGIYNQYWVYPSKEETPKGACLVEGACYWGESEVKENEDRVDV